MKVLSERVPSHAVKKARDFVSILPQEELEWPSHRLAFQIMQLLAYLPATIGILCEPQIVRQPGGGTDPVFLDFHRDQEPPWANGRKYHVIYGVALTNQYYANGGVAFDHAGRLEIPNLGPGSVYAFGREELHSPGVNQTNEARMAIYFRFLWPTLEDDDAEI
jgi:hypothetical protein